MSDLSKHQVADRLAEWKARDEYIEELIAENHQQHTDLQRMAAECAGLAMRLEHSEARTEWLRKRLSRWDVWAGFWLAWWQVSGRE